MTLGAFFTFTPDVMTAVKKGESVSLVNAGHDFDKQNNFTLTERKGGRMYDLWRCNACGLEGKRYGLAATLVVTKAPAKQCQAPSVTGRFLRVSGAFPGNGSWGANLLLHSVHEVVATPAGQPEDGGAWVMGAEGKPAKLLADEYTLLSEADAAAHKATLEASPLRVNRDETEEDETEEDETPEAHSVRMLQDLQLAGHGSSANYAEAMVNKLTAEMGGDGEETDDEPHVAPAPKLVSVVGMPLKFVLCATLALCMDLPNATQSQRLALGYYVGNQNVSNSVDLIVYDETEQIWHRASDYRTGVAAFQAIFGNGDLDERGALDNWIRTLGTWRDVKVEADVKQDEKKRAADRRRSDRARAAREAQA